jgi:hypothetical protein
MSEVTFNERRTRWRDEYRNKMAKTASTLNDLLRDHFLPDPIKGEVRSSLCSLPSADAADAISVEIFGKTFADHKIARVESSLAHLNKTLNRYFLGELPFKKIKSREDLPDGLILAAADETLKDSESGYFVCGDQTLRKAFSCINATLVYEPFEEVMKATPLAAACRDLDEEGAWQKISLI